jgi:high-affinity Fe2+/Pb2+ permease
MAYDMRFYTGKDDGYLVRIESICLFSTILFYCLGRKSWLLNIIIGFVVGLIASVIAYFLISFIYMKDTGLVFHITACLIFIVIFLFSEHSGRRISQNDKSIKQ